MFGGIASHQGGLDLLEAWFNRRPLMISSLGAEGPLRD
jgi:hypothetical protein